MGKRNPELRQVSFWVDEEERDALQQLCKTRGESVSDAFRKWITASLDAQTTELSAIHSSTAKGHRTSVVEPETLKVLMKRIEGLERAMPKFDLDDLVRMKSEVLDGEFGSMRHRIGVVESQVQSLGGSISWATSPEMSTIKKG